MAVVGKGVLQLVANHHILVNTILILVLGKEIISHLKCMTSIIIVCIDNCKWSVDHIDTAHDRMTCAPWFHTSFRNLIAFRKIVQILEYKDYLCMLAHAVADGCTEICLVFFLYDKYNFFKSCLERIIDRKIDNNISLFIYRVDLFETAVSASHTCCHYY